MKLRLLKLLRKSLSEKLFSMLCVVWYKQLSFEKNVSKSDFLHEQINLLLNYKDAPQHLRCSSL